MKKEAALRRQLELVNKKNLPDLKEKFLELYGFECGNTTSRNLRKRLAYRLQEVYYGGVNERDMEALNAIADNDPLSNLKNVAANRLTKTRGTRFCRTWKCVDHEAIAFGDGTFSYNDKTYKSLSAIAREITGTRWNGKLFFGVR